jgi:hypothetical protein
MAVKITKVDYLMSDSALTCNTFGHMHNIIHAFHGPAQRERPGLTECQLAMPQLAEPVLFSFPVKSQHREGEAWLDISSRKCFL